MNLMNAIKNHARKVLQNTINYISVISYITLSNIYVRLVIYVILMFISLTFLIQTSYSYETYFYSNTVQQRYCKAVATYDFACFCI